MKILFGIILICINLYAQTTQKKESSFFDDIFNEVTSTLDSNLSDKIKLETVKSYINSIKFDDKVDKKKYQLNIMGHYENFILLGGYTNNKLTEVKYNKFEPGVTTDSNFIDQNRSYTRNSNEAQYQISIKIPLYKNFLATGGDLFTAYTQNSYWQVYDNDHSRPFRETNYMPELFLEWQPNKRYGESILRKIRFAIIHQSNGQDVGYSRSWNRTEVYFLFQKENWYYGLNAWHRWKEDKKPSLSDVTSKDDPNYNLYINGDDNPELTNYIGNQRFFVRYNSKYANITLAHQNRIENYDPNKGNIKLDIAFASINSNFDFFVRYFNGYGESLIDYNVKIERISFGILISDWIN